MKKKHLVYLLHFFTYSYCPSFLDTQMLYFFKYLCLSTTYLPTRHLLRLIQLQLNMMVFAFLCLYICFFYIHVFIFVVFLHIFVNSISSYSPPPASPPAPIPQVENSLSPLGGPPAQYETQKEKVILKT